MKLVTTFSLIFRIYCLYIHDAARDLARLLKCRGEMRLVSLFCAKLCISEIVFKTGS